MAAAPVSSASFLAQRLPALWYQPTLAPALLPLLPLAGVFGLLAARRRAAFASGSQACVRMPVPVVVVGNITVGGSGKTPLTLWLCDALRGAGWRPGIVSRGYGSGSDAVRAAVADDAASGDEPALLARRSGVPVYVGRDRVGAARALLAAHPDLDVIVADDGLQHYALARDVEIAVFDGRGAGNGRLLPAGPLREPLTRLADCDALVWNGAPEARAARAAAALPQFAMRLRGDSFFALGDRDRRCRAAALAGRRLYAIAGIGDPQRFFRQLEALGLSFVARPFPDHHAYAREDLAFASDGVLLMTEKDAVKCASLLAPAALAAPGGRLPAALPEAWVLPVAAEITPITPLTTLIESAAAPASPGLLELILEKLNGRTPA